MQNREHSLRGTPRFGKAGKPPLAVGGAIKSGWGCARSSSSSFSSSKRVEFGNEDEDKDEEKKQPHLSSPTFNHTLRDATAKFRLASARVRA